MLTVIIYAASMLEKKWERVEKGLPATRKAFVQLSSTISPASQEKWAAQEAEALLKGGDSLAIYDVTLEEGLM
jgi:hypothetical protein